MFEVEFQLKMKEQEIQKLLKSIYSIIKENECCGFDKKKLEKEISFLLPAGVECSLDFIAIKREVELNFFYLGIPAVFCVDEKRSGE